MIVAAEAALSCMYSINCSTDISKIRFLFLFLLYINSKYYGLQPSAFINKMKPN